MALRRSARGKSIGAVRANRVVTVTSEKERQAAPIAANSNPITEGKSAGWRLIYCKGPEGDRLARKARAPIGSIGWS